MEAVVLPGFSSCALPGLAHAYVGWGQLALVIGDPALGVLPGASEGSVVGHCGQAVPERGIEDVLRIALLALGKGLDGGPVARVERGGGGHCGLRGRHGGGGLGRWCMDDAVLDDKGCQNVVRMCGHV